jgi:hypothetical protein
MTEMGDGLCVSASLSEMLRLSTSGLLQFEPAPALSSEAVYPL